MKRSIQNALTLSKTVLLSTTSLVFYGIFQKPTAAKKTEQLAKDVQTSAAPVVKNIANKVKEVSEPIIKTVQQAVSTPDANMLYQKCAGCHGLNAEKKALNKSAIIKDWNSSQSHNFCKG